jgi:hypothetical protein
LDVNGNTASFGVNGLNPGYSQIYTNGTPATVDFSASASTVNWTWYQGNTNPQLKLDSTNKLNLYSTANPTTAQIVLNPVGTSTFAQGLTVTGTLTTGGAFTTSGSLTASGGTVTGGTNGLTINSGGTNKNITLSPNGTGVTTTTKPLRVTSATTSTSSTTGALTVSGGVGVGGALNVGSSLSTSRLTVAGTDATAANSVANFTDSTGKSLLFVQNDGTTTVGTRLGVGASPAALSPLWQGAAVIGQNASDKVVVGSVANSYTGATVGAHTTGLNAWADLNLAGSNLIFRSNGETEGARLTSAGNVGIGTPWPTAKLDVAGSIKSTGGYVFQGLQTLTDPNLVPMQFLNYFGLQSMAVKFDGSNLADVLLSFKDSGSEVNNWSLGRWGARLDKTTSTFNILAQPGATSDVFRVSTSGAAIPFLTITPAGNFGIGTTTPSSTLDVVGDAKISGTLTVGGQSVVTASTLV